MTTRLRVAASLSAQIAAIVSVAFMLRAAHRNPSVLLLVLMAIWVVAPFVSLLWAIRASHRWQEFARKSLYILTLVIAACALATYTIDALGPPRVKAAAVFVVVPLASWILSGIVLAAVVLKGTRPAA
jgi:hypothetical protein